MRTPSTLKFHARPGIAVLVAAGLAWSQAQVPQSAPQGSDRGPAPDVADPAPLAVNAEQVWEHPSSLLGQTVLVEVQIHSRMQSWNPFLTRFGDGEFSAWAAWSAGQLPWIEDDYNAPRARLFARRGGSAEWALEDARTYDRFELSCVVRSVFAGRPWLEVLGVKPLVRKLGEGSVIHATRGLEFMKRGAFEAAIGEFERAASSGIPERAMAELEGLMEDCRERLSGKADSAPED